MFLASFTFIYQSSIRAFKDSGQQWLQSHDSGVFNFPFLGSVAPKLPFQSVEFPYFSRSSDPNDLKFSSLTSVTLPLWSKSVSRLPVAGAF